MLIIGTWYIVIFTYCGIWAEISFFRAAVYEHAVILPMERELPVKRSTALGNMMKNMEIYSQQAQVASQQKVDILVFPEDGIYGYELSRQAMEPYLEYIPDEEWNACDFPDKYENTEIQRNLSCLAKDASLYLVANIGDRQPCFLKNDTYCPKDGHYQFNTNVVYNRKGDLIAKYHKINLFFERQFDTPPTPKIVTFNTPFGKFAVFTCFDILFKNPAIDSLLPDVGNIVFPTAWMDALPLLAAIEYHSAFAAGAKVNFLAANINRPLKGFHGSGIYSPNGYKAFQYNESQGGKLLVADLPVIKTNYFGTANYSQTFRSLQNSVADQFHSYVFHDRFTFIPINNNNGNVSVCNGDLCCFLEYERIYDTSEYFAFGAFDGLHTYEGSYYLQICTLLKCKTSQKESCGEPIKKSSTKFIKMKMTGSFGTRYIFPEVLLTDNVLLKLSSGQFWSYDNGTLETMAGFEHPVISVALFARDYARDDANQANHGNKLFVGIILIAVIYSILQ